MRGAWRRLPVETVIVAAAAVGASGLVHWPREVWFLRLVLAGVIATPLALAAHRLDRLGSRAPVIAGGIAAAGVLAAVSAGLPAVRAFDDPVFAWPYGLSVVAAMLVPFVVPGPAFARFVRRFFEQTTTWGILCGGALAAVGVVTFALVRLFDLRVEDLGVDAAIAVGAGFVLVYLDRLLADDAGGRMPELWRRLATMIGAPFVSVMLAILVIYEAFVRVRSELPRNVLSPLIIAAGLVGFVSTLIISSVLAEDRGTGVLAPADPHRWARRWSVRLTRAFPVILLALLPMAGWALWLRVGQHGVTPFRAVRGMGLLCLTCLGAIGTLRWARGWAALTWEVPAAVIAFALVAAFGPLSAVELSIRSQAHAVARLLDTAGAGRVVAGDVPAQRIELGRERYDALRGAMRTLAELGGQPAVERVVRGATAVCAERWETTACLERLGVHDAERGRDASSSGELAELEAHGRFATAAGYVERVELARQRDEADPRPADGGARDGFRLAPDRVVMFVDGAPVAEASLAALLSPRETGLSLPVATRPLVRADGAIAGELAVTQLRVWWPVAGAPQAIGLTGIAIWHRWP